MKYVLLATIILVLSGIVATTGTSHANRQVYSETQCTPPTANAPAVKAITSSAYTSPNLKWAVIRTIYYCTDGTHVIIKKRAPLYNKEFTNG